MKKNITRPVILAVLAIVITVFVSACGSSGGAAAPHSGAGGNSMADAQYAVNEEAYYEGEGSYSSQKDSDGALISEKNDQKIIYTASMTMQSTEFDQTMKNIDDQVNAIEGAYYEKRSVSAASKDFRSAELIIRVPVKQFGDFLSVMRSAATVTYEYQNAEDVSDSYYDTETRLATARTKLERLQKLLSEATDMENIILLEEAISDTEYEIDSLQGTLKHLDSRIDYSTVTISLAEVVVVDDTEKPVTYGERLAASFNRGIRSFVSGMGEIFLWLAESWPVLVVLFIIFILPAIILIAVTRKRRKARKNAGRPSGPAA